MNKLQMVQNMILTEIRRVGICSIDDEKLQEAWNIADAMQAEADKRKSSEFPDVLRGACGEIVAIKVDDVEWQPDWSQAPDWASWLAMDFRGTSYFYEQKPRKSIKNWVVNGGHSNLAWCDGYHFGDWRNSLRKRPE